jgi:hypothetical protein
MLNSTRPANKVPPPRPKAVRDGQVTIADFEMRCYILDTPENERVLSRQDLLKALGRSTNVPGRAPKGMDEEMPSFLDAANLKPFVSSQLAETTKPVVFSNLTGHKTIGYKADILKDVCYVFIDAAKAGVLRPSQLHIAERCEALVRAFASVGIRALVDEATGFQEVRPRDDLQRYLDTFLLKEYSKWVKRFPDEFFEGIFRMKGWTWDEASSKKPVIVGNYVNDFVYQRIAPLVLEELKNRNPLNANGRRAAKHHQWLTPDVGHPKLQEHLQGVMAIQRIADGNWRKFIDMMDKAYPRYGHTLAITFEEADQQENEKKLDSPFDHQLRGLLSIPPPSKEEGPKEGDELNKETPVLKKPHKKAGN